MYYVLLSLLHFIAKSIYHYEQTTHQNFKWGYLYLRKSFDIAKSKEVYFDFNEICTIMAIEILSCLIGDYDHIIYYIPDT